jgi:hypothetical protein
MTEWDNPRKITPVLVGEKTYFTREILHELKGDTVEETIKKILHYLEFMLRIDAQMSV